MYTSESLNWGWKLQAGCGIARTIISYMYGLCHDNGTTKTCNHYMATNALQMSMMHKKTFF